MEKSCLSTVYGKERNKSYLETWTTEKRMKDRVRKRFFLER